MGLVFAFQPSGESVKRCAICLLPTIVPGSDIDATGRCHHCREHQPQLGAPRLETIRKAREQDLETTLKVSKGDRQHDCIVCLSGGKDSVYLLHKVKNEYGLRVLAFTTDINIGDVAWDNIRRTVEKLDVEHVVYRPEQEFYRKLFRFLLQNQEERGAVHTVSYVYAPLFEGNAIKLAVEKEIPLILAGYSPGQPDAERMEYEFPPLAIAKVDWTPPELRESGAFDEADLARFWNPALCRPGTRFPRYIAPFHAWEYNQDEIMKKVVQLGLISDTKHASPVYSNYPINWLLMYSDLQNLGYNPYAPEFSTLIREGKANRAYWRVMGPVVDFMIRRKFYLGHHVKTHLDWLGLTPSELKITRPRRAEWPEFVHENIQEPTSTAIGAPQV
jgi:hypothetical protein